MSAIVSELFINQSVVFHQLSEKVEQDVDVSSDTLVLTSALKVDEFGSTFPKGGKGGFGLLSLKAISCPLTQLEQDFMFQVDCSGSMSDICSDGRSKMQHILHTLKNMILYFKENPSLKANVTIHAFDDSIFKIVDRILIDETTYDSIIAKVDTIKPRNCTNIEKALQDTKEYMSQLLEQYPTTIKTHIFMTDGQATAGNSKHTYLRELVDNSNTNVFIGFGLDHDAALLNVVSEGEKSSYYFIDKLENAGLVYGEILHGIVYKFLENIEISITDGLIYDYNTNTWNPTLKVGDLSSESSKFYHITGNNSSVVQVTGKRSDTGIDIVSFVPIQEEATDLTKYIYRQRIQQILFMINKHNKEKHESINYHLVIEERKKLKTIMQQLFDELKKYMAENNLTDDVLLKNLCDDIYICHRTFGTTHGDMYCTARGNSQGQQRAYTATHLPERCIQRQNAIYRSSNRIYQGADEDEADEEDIEFNELQHDVSDATDTPYRTQTLTQVMRSVSATTGGQEDEEETQAEY